MGAEQRGEFAQFPEFVQDGKKEKGAVDITAEFEQLCEMMPQLGKKMTAQEQAACENFAGKIVDQLLVDIKNAMPAIANYSGDQQTFKESAVGAMVEALPRLINLNKAGQEISVETYMKQQLVDILLEKQKALLKDLDIISKTGRERIKSPDENNFDNLIDDESKARHVVETVIKDLTDQKLVKHLSENKRAAMDFVVHQLRNSSGVKMDEGQLKRMIAGYAGRMAHKREYAGKRAAA